MQDRHAEAQENGAKPVLGKKILPAPKIVNQITNSIFPKEEGVQGREARQRYRRGYIGGRTCLWSHLDYPSASTSAHIGSRTHAELRCLDSWAAPCSREEMLHQLFLFTHLPKLLLPWVSCSFICSLSDTKKLLHSFSHQGHLRFMAEISAIHSPFNDVTPCYQKYL